MCIVVLRHYPHAVDLQELRKQLGCARIGGVCAETIKSITGGSDTRMWVWAEYDTEPRGVQTDGWVRCKGDIEDQPMFVAAEAAAGCLDTEDPIIIDEGPRVRDAESDDNADDDDGESGENGESSSSDSETDDEEQCATPTAFVRLINTACMKRRRESTETSARKVLARRIAEDGGFTSARSLQRLAAAVILESLDG